MFFETLPSSKCLAQRFARTLTVTLALFIGLLIAACWPARDSVQAYGRLVIASPMTLAPQGEAFPLPEAKVGSPYEYQFQTEGGLAPLKWSVIASALPPGLRLEENGKLTGAPTQAKADAYAFVVEVADSARTPQRFSLSCLLLVQAAPLRIVAGAPKLRIVTNDAVSQPSAASRNNQSGNEADTQIADVSAGAFTAAPVAVSAPVAMSAAQIQAPIIKAPLIAGSKTIEGSATATSDVIITITSKDKSTLTSPPLTPKADKTFSFTLTKALALGDEVKAEQTIATQKVSSGVVTVEKAPLLPAYFSQPRYGDRQIEVNGKKGQKIEILVDGEAVELVCKDAAGNVQNAACTQIALMEDGANVIALKQALNAKLDEALSVKLIDLDGRQAISNQAP